MGSVVPNNIVLNFLFHVDFLFNFNICFISVIDILCSKFEVQEQTQFSNESGPVPRSILSFQIK